MRRWLKKWLPNQESLKNEKSLGWLGDWLQNHPYIWVLNRKTVARGVAAGLLVAFIPLPLQIFFSALLAFVFRANLPVAIVATLVSNPITFIPITYVIYKVGAFVTHSQDINHIPPFPEFHWHWESFINIWKEVGAWIKSLGKVYLIGLCIVSICASILGYCLVQLSWQIYIARQWRLRKKKRS